jgi:hypothetical protein
MFDRFNYNIRTILTLRVCTHTHTHTHKLTHKTCGEVRVPESAVSGDAVSPDLSHRVLQGCKVAEDQAGQTVPTEDSGRIWHLTI